MQKSELESQASLCLRIVLQSCKKFPLIRLQVFLWSSQQAHITCQAFKVKVSLRRVTWPQRSNLGSFALAFHLQKEGREKIDFISSIHVCVLGQRMYLMDICRKKPPDFVLGFIPSGLQSFNYYSREKKKIIKPVIFQNNKLKLLLQTLVENMLQFALMFLSERSVIRQETLERRSKPHSSQVINRNSDVDRTPYNKYSYNVKKSFERQ